MLSQVSWILVEDVLSKKRKRLETKRSTRMRMKMSERIFLHISEVTARDGCDTKEDQNKFN